MTGARGRAGSLAAAFIAGVATGAALVWPLAAWRIEDLGVQNDALLLQAEDAQHRLDRLEETVGRIREPVIRSVEVQADVSDPDERTAVERAVAKVAGEFVGKPVSAVDRGILTGTLEGRLVDVDGRAYRLTLSFALVAPETVLVVQARAVATGPPGRAFPPG